MGEVLAPKRQTVVDRLRRRFDHYRKHHNACLPRYEQSADGLFEKHKQETIMLKQRYLESKAKKSKTNKHSNSNEHKHTIPRDTLSDTQKLLSHPKPVKRPREHSPVISLSSEVATDDSERSTKTTKSSNYESTPSSEHQCKKSSSSLSTQQFPINGHKSRNKIRQFSPKTKSAKILDSCTVPPTEVKDLINSSHTDGQTSLSLKNQKTPLTITNTPTKEAASCNLVSNTSECKQEKEQRSNSTLCQFQEDSVNYNENIQQNQDRLSDTFPSISGLAEDSCEDVLHPDILKDLFDDVFTNSPNMMDFFDDSVGSIKVGEDEDIMNKNDSLMKSSPYESTVDKLSFSIPHVATQQTPGLFANSLTTVSTALTSTKTTFSTMPSVSISSSKGYTNSSQCLPPFNGLSPSHQLPDNLSMDFKLTEPSPAALTLKQMAEQHQSMQQKQQLGRNLESPNRMTFSVDPFPDPVPFRNRFFLNNNNNATKSSISLFNSTALVSERKYPDIEPLTTFKEESCSERLLESQQRSLIMKPAEQKSPCVTSARLGWALASVDHSNTPGHPLDSQYVTADSRTQVSINENHVLGIGFSTKAVQQVKPTDSDIRQQAQQPYSNMYNIYTPQHSSSNIVNPMFATPVSHSMPYNAQFTSTVERLPPEFKLDQPNTISLVEQTGQTPTAYQQTYMRHQQIHNQNMHNQWRHVQLPQNNLNIPNYEHHDGYRQLPSHSNQITTTVHHSVNYPYGSVSGHASKPNLPTFSNQPIIQHRQQLNSQFHQRQQLSVEHRVMSAMGGQTLGTETTSHVSATSAAVYNITQDSSHINLDFLENINSNTSDLLNFDQVLHGETETTFQLLG